MIVGKVEQLILPENLLNDSGDIDFEAMNVVSVAGLDTYYSLKK